MARVALITGITGQDGSYLAELLLDKGYKVYGIVRRHSSIHTERIDHIFHRLTLIYGDMTDQTSLTNAMHEILAREGKSNIERLEVYNLAAQSHVKVSFEVPEYTGNTDALGTLRLLECIRKLGLETKARFYQASTSELYGDTTQRPQNESTPFSPQSPYASAKLYSYHIVHNYRKSYGIYACNGILFNHASPRRGETFVERKISLGVKKLLKDQTAVLKLGNLNASRDIGFAGDYVEGMWLMLQQDEPGDYVLSTGETHTIREIVECAFDNAGMKIEWKGEGLEERGYVGEWLVVVVDPKYFRPAEVNFLQGDASKAKEKLGWEPKHSMLETLRMMFKADLGL